MKKLLSITLTTLLVLFASQAFGQTATESDSESLNASAEIIGTGLEIEEIKSLDFGILTDDQTRTISYNSDDAGVLDISGESETDVYFDAPSEITLTRTGESETMTIDNLTFGTNTTEDANSASEYNLNDPVQTSSDTPGQLYFYVGGDLTIPANQEPGEYTGNATIEVSYNSF